MTMQLRKSIQKKKSVVDNFLKMQSASNETIMLFCS